MEQDKFNQINELVQQYGYEFKSPRELKRMTRRVRRKTIKKLKKLGIQTVKNADPPKAYQSWKLIAMRQNGRSMSDIMAALGLKKKYITIKVEENENDGKC